ncbi:signal peptidase I [Promicromonospora panici]|uniref:signal peptidase I n=1 Tax=Promicromonospora panici TaxID=2219658 RepID=UPI0013EA7E2E|nr:signal peptidase I [Promicromonospora panici]
MTSTAAPSPTRVAAREHTRHQPSRRSLAGAGRLLVSVAALVVVAAVVALVVAPRVMGWMPLTILSGSMEPTIPVGSQVVVDPIEDEGDVARIQVGDVVTFMPQPDDPTLVTHRVVTRTVTADGTVTVTTQGDANDAPDGVDLTERELRAVVRYHVPYAGYVAQLIDRDQKTVGVATLAGGLGVYAVAQLLLAARDRRRAASRSDGAAPAAGAMTGRTATIERPVR